MHSAKYAVERLHAIMAGYGKPYAVLTPARKQILRALHDGVSVTEMPAIMDIPHSSLHAELSPLVEAGLLRQENDRYQPAFFIADEVETRRVFEHAEKRGGQLSDHLLSHWGTLKALYGHLTANQHYDFRSVAFFLVGSIVLDVGLLAALARDKSLMPEKPYRPSPDCPDAQYYFWMIEGEWDQLGRYGQRSTSLMKWPEWQLITFGQYKINGVSNARRNKFEEAALAALEGNEFTNIERLAEHINVPLFGESDAEKWAEGTQANSEQLVGVYHRNEKSIRDLYATLRSSHYASEGFGEFFCWYDHIAYASAIDRLVEAGVMSIPEERYITVIWREVSGKGW